MRKNTMWKNVAKQRNCERADIDPFLFKRDGQWKLMRIL